MKNLFCDVFVGGLTLTHRKLQMNKNGLGTGVIFTEKEI